MWYSRALRAFREVFCPTRRAGTPRFAKSHKRVAVAREIFDLLKRYDQGFCKNLEGILKKWPFRLA